MGQSLKANNMIIAGTGSRSLLTEDKDKRSHILDLTKEALNNIGNPEIMSGMAEGFDECIAKAAVDLELPLHLVVPNYGYGMYYWGKNSLLKKDRFDTFKAYLAYASENGSIEYVIEDVHNTSGIYVNGIHSNFLRNSRMVERADHFLIYNEKSTGTKDCFNKILKSKKPYQIMV